MSEVKKRVSRQKGKKNKREYTVSSKALAQRRNNAALKPAETDEEKNYNARQIEHIMNIHKIAATADRKDLNTLKSCFVSYLQLCQEDGFRVSNLGAYAAMGMSKQLFELFKKKDDPEIKQFVNMVLTTCAISRESLIAENKLNPVIGIFWQRNYDGLRNDTEQAQAIADQDNEFEADKSYKDKYRNLIER